MNQPVRHNERAEHCDCEECRLLDERFPREGKRRQLRLRLKPRTADCRTCEGHGRLIRTVGNSTLCPYDDTVPCPDCEP